MSVDTRDTKWFTYHEQCKTCNMTEKVHEFIEEMIDINLGYAEMSRQLHEAQNVKISPDALSNHLRKHRKLDTLLGVVLPPVTAQTTPKGWSPGVELEGDTGVVTSTPQTNDKITDFSDILRELGIDPDSFEVVGPARISKWQQRARQGSEGFKTVWLTAYRLNIQKKSTAKQKEKDTYLLDLVKDVKPNKNTPFNGKYTFVFAAGDLQLGKSDADGTEGIVSRYRESLQKAVNKVHELREHIGPILISWVGDCIEGMVSQGGKNARRTELTTTQQVKLLRKLMFETIKAFAPLTNDLQVVSVPGNHDEAQREPVTTDYSDSWAVDALAAVSEALELNPEAFGHVTTHLVPFDELTITIETSGSVLTHAHGHQWNKGKHFDWWSGQHWGGHDVGEADILICGHFHSGSIEQENFKHMVRTPSFEKESTYFRHRTGKVGNPSAVTFLTKDGKLKYHDFE